MQKIAITALSVSLAIVLIAGIIIYQKYRKSSEEISVLKNQIKKYEQQLKEGQITFQKQLNEFNSQVLNSNEESAKMQTEIAGLQKKLSEINTGLLKLGGLKPGKGK